MQLYVRDAAKYIHTHPYAHNNIQGIPYLAACKLLVEEKYTQVRKPYQLGAEDAPVLAQFSKQKGLYS